MPLSGLPLAELVQGGVFGGIGEEPVPRADRAKNVPPEIVDLFGSKHFGFPFVGDPRPLLEFVFELSFGPACVSDKSANGEAFEEALLGFRGIQVNLKIELSIGVVPANGAEGELFGVDRAAHEDGDFLERFEFGVGKEVAD